MIAEGAGLASAAIWVYLLLGRGGFWRIRETRPPALPILTAERLPRIAVVIPARDEAAVIGEAVTSLLTQDYPGELRVYLADDDSSDCTAEVARRAAREAGAASRLNVSKARPLPPGWTGKLWAVSEGAQEALAGHPDYLLLTDADVVHARDNVSGLVARAETGKFALVSLMVKLQCETLPERWLIPAFVFFFLKLYPPSWISNQARRTAGAAGGCMLVRSSALAAIGGIEAIRGELIDDCALARAVKRHGKIWLGVTTGTRSSRDYRSFAEIWRMISRTAYTQLRHSPALLAGTVCGMALTYLTAPLLLLSSRSTATICLGVTLWLMMALLFYPTLRFYHRPACWGLAIPFIALFYLAATIGSAVSYWQGRGGLWKGRFQDTLRTGT